MIRNFLNFVDQNDKFYQENGTYVLDCQRIKSDDVLSFDDTKLINIYFKNIEAIDELNLFFYDNVSVNLKTISTEKLNKLTINGKINKNCHISLYFADFSTNLADVNFNFLLTNEGSDFECCVASLASNQDRKHFIINATNEVGKTTTLIKNVGVAKDASLISFKGASTIAENAAKSKARQSSRIVVFDENSKGWAEPHLNIYNNDVEASHGATVGKISDSEIFYLMSRGLSFDQARELITKSCLKPILNGFSEPVLIDQISSLIEERV